MPIDARSTQGACMIPNHLRRTARLVLAAGVLLSAPGRVGAGDDAVFRPHRQRERRPGRRSQPAGRHHGRPDEHRRGGCRPGALHGGADRWLWRGVPGHRLRPGHARHASGLGHGVRRRRQWDLSREPDDRDGPALCLRGRCDPGRCASPGAAKSSHTTLVHW